MLFAKIRALSLENKGQRHILNETYTRSGIRLKKCFIVFHGPDENNPFMIEDVSKKSKEYSETINDNIWRLVKIKNQDEEVMVEPGEQCSTPYECWYYGYCHKKNN